MRTAATAYCHHAYARISFNGIHGELFSLQWHHNITSSFVDEIGQRPPAL
jgi:hypothetical protein